MKQKFFFREIVQMQGALERLAQFDFKEPAVTLDVSRCLRPMVRELREYDKQRTRLMRMFGTLVQATAEQPEHYAFGERQNEFVEAHEALLDSEIEVRLQLLPIVYLNTLIGFPPGVLQDLLPLFVGGEGVDAD